ncbi:hypothetical protein NUU61_003602 [Penicillium alfredii]|uniref:Zn(2)-C6 fungal-type domain-containing protein n=1 Tax=Penicillium alfredii TaxID=1506179 RepID=A0A9W9FJN3_9EURO|nr:uncharacterized protein NUU61_003602 [Penicillium alfredii]KAJ5101380.1 hypothetical protein NUU61_003602 [Penicillium alfredii]
MPEPQKRHCWECLRRRLVCDNGHPGCSRCAVSGIDCPGYDAKQPMRLRWLAPGRVKSRQRKNGVNRQKTGKASTEIFQKDSSDEERVVVVPRTKIKPQIDPLLDAYEYFNVQIFPNLYQKLRLGSNANIYKIQPRMLQSGIQYPDHLRLGLVCMTLSHRMNRMGHDPDSKPLERSLYHYRGIMIRSLNDQLNSLNKHNSNATLIGTLILLLADAQQGIAQHWRYHLEGARRIIMLQGGMYQSNLSPGVLPIILCFIYHTVIGDTSSPATDMLVEKLPLEELYLMLEQYGGNGYGFQMCPTPLFIEIVKINHIRARASRAGPIEEDDLRREAWEALCRIYAFSSEEWSEANDRFTDASILLSKIYQSAVALYCISSCQSLGILPPDHLLNNNCSMEAGILHGLLYEAATQHESTGILGYSLWPLMVLGVEARDGGSDPRAFVIGNLKDLSVSTGTYCPLAAKEVLESLWASGETGWDVCFDKPYLFTSVLTVNRGQWTNHN